MIRLCHATNWKPGLPRAVQYAVVRGEIKPNKRQQEEKRKSLKGSRDGSTNEKQIQ